MAPKDWSDVALDCVRHLWWCPLPFVGGWIVKTFAAKYGKYRNMK